MIEDTFQEIKLQELNSREEGKKGIGRKSNVMSSGSCQIFGFQRMDRLHLCSSHLFRRTLSISFTVGESLTPTFGR